MALVRSPIKTHNIHCLDTQINATGDENLTISRSFTQLEIGGANSGNADIKATGSFQIFDNANDRLLYDGIVFPTGIVHTDVYDEYTFTSSFHRVSSSFSRFLLAEPGILFGSSRIFVKSDEHVNT